MGLLVKLSRLLAITPATTLIFSTLAIANDEDIFFSELPVVASVSRLPQRLADAPTAVTVIDREMIRSLGIRDLNDIFRLVPGFQTHPNNTDAARVTYHGLTDDSYAPRVQVLVDGRSMHSPLFRNGVNWATIPVAPEDIERIEVVRGTNAVSYGTNAFLGVINIITLEPSLAHGFSVSSNRGTQGVRDYTLRNGGKLGESGDFRFTYQQRDDDGLRNQADWVDSNRSRLFDFRSDFSLTDRDTLEISAGHIEATTQRGRLGAKDFPGALHDYSQSDTYFQAQWKRARDGGGQNQLRYSYVADWASDNYFNPNNGGYYHDRFGDIGERHELEFQQTALPTNTLRTVWGVSWRHDETHSETILKSPVIREVSRGFSSLEWRPVDWFTGNLGGSFEKDSLAGNHFSPRFSTNFHLNRENTIRLGYSRAYRTGSVMDYRGDYWDGTKYQFRADPSMKSEQLDSWEVGYLGDWRNWRMSLDVRIFDERVKNRLYTYDRNRGNNAIPDLTGPIQDVHIYGVEYQWKWQPFEQTKVMVNQTCVHAISEYIDGVVSLTDPSNAFYQSAKKVDQLAELSSPRYSNSVLLMQKLPYGFEFTIAGYWVGKMKWSENSEVYAYRRGDLRLAYPFKWAGKGGEVAYTIQSFNGAHGEYRYEEKPTDRVVDRRSWLTVRLDY